MRGNITAGDVEDVAIPCSYAPLPDEEEYASSPSNSNQGLAHRKSLRVLLPISFCSLLLLALAVLLSQSNPPDAVVEDGIPTPSDHTIPLQRGVAEGVSEKSVRSLLRGSSPYPWTNQMLSWQRTAYHFQPEKNWMNDPNGPLFYKGWYHFFYQYNPYSAVWGNITWGHAVSLDLINWLHLPLAMVPDKWYDINGVWTGSATILPNGTIVMLYTGATDKYVQVQNLAFPADPSDPLLINWVKSDRNPVLAPPPGIGSKDFRDPTTAWTVSDGTWRITIGSKVNKTGISLVYKTLDFFSYELLDGVMHAVPGTGMWECVDFYPVSMTGTSGLDTSANGPGLKYVLKASLDNDRNDYYATGEYDEEKGTWTPDNAVEDVGIGKRYDYGNFYASKTFYDQNKKRRVLWGWIVETDAEHADIKKGWASLQSIPRTVLFDYKTGSNLLQWPVEEIEKLRTTEKRFSNIKLESGSVVPLDVDTAAQLDINAEFEIAEGALKEVAEADVDYDCRTSDGATGRGLLGPFGFSLLADHNRTEQLAVYFYVGKNSDGFLRTFFCHDESRSSKADDILKRGVYGSAVPVLSGEKLSVRILVDHSIVESFAQGGRTCITSRVYPTEAIYGAARLFLFNNATLAGVTATSVKVWQMKSAYIHPYTAEDGTR